MSLQLFDITKSYGYHQILNGVSFIVNENERTGLVGANGVGKSTLLKIIAGAETPDSGRVHIDPGLRLGYLEQVIGDIECKTLNDLIVESMQHIHDLETRMRDLEAVMTAGSDDIDAIMDEYGEISERFERYGGYDIEYRVDKVLDGLDVAHIARSRSFVTLSGGEKSRVGLALLLLQSPDILLLDEPTNHLDFHSLAWLEDYLQQYRGIVLIVSHDRHFLNRIVTVIVEINEHSRQAKRYSGNYDVFHQAKVQELRKWRDDYALQKEEIKALKEEIKVTSRRNANYRPPKDGDKFIRNYKIAQHDQTVAKRVRRAEERLRRIEDDPIPQPPDDLTFNAEFDPNILHGHFPLNVSGLTKSYEGRCILNDLSFALEHDSRVVLVGANGAGKSTLLRILVGQETADAGDIQFNPAVNIGYLSQEQGLLNASKTVFEAYCDALPGAEQQLKAALLTSGLFYYDNLEKRVGDLSSGQERKLQIARLIASKANLLILDEPTNYISLDVLENFEAALKGFPGPVLAASHDRRFIQRFNGQIWELCDGKITVYPGGYEEYISSFAR